MARSLWAQAAQDARAILWKLYPKVKFSVISQGFTGIESIVTVYWENGPETGEIVVLLQPIVGNKVAIVTRRLVSHV